MARLRRDTARRSIEDFFRQLPPEATVEVTRVGPPPAGTALAIRLEIAAPETVVETVAPPAATARPRGAASKRKPLEDRTDAQVHGSGKAGVGDSHKRQRRQTPQGGD